MFMEKNSRYDRGHERLEGHQYRRVPCPAQVIAVNLQALSQDEKHYPHQARENQITAARSWTRQPRPSK